MTAELKQIAKQVSSLNRLIELLMMQEDDSLQEDFVFNLGWVLILPGKGPEIGSYKYCPGISKEHIACEEAWNHPVTQKAWSDELVRVARELKESIPCSEWTIYNLLCEIAVNCGFMDETTENLQAELKELRLELDNAVINSQSRIKELEGAIKNSLRCGWHSMEGSIDGTFDDLTEQEIRQFRKDAKNALAKESEG